MNRLRTLASSAVLIASLSQSASAQTATSSQTPIRDPQAIALASRSLAAMGAPSASLQTNSRATGLLTMQFDTPVTASVVLESKGLTVSRAEMQQPNGTSVRVLQGGQAAIKNADGSIRRLNQVNTFCEHVGYIPAFSLLAEVPNPTAQVEFITSAGTNGSPDDIIAVSLGQSSDPGQVVIQQSLSRRLFYINSASGLVDKIEYTYYSDAPNPGIPMSVQEIFSDYRNVAGIAVPFHRATYLDGRLESDLQLSIVSFNVGIPDSDFVVPGSLQ
jgi:hypothetical protein